MRRLRPLPSLPTDGDEHRSDIAVTVDGQDPPAMTTARDVDVERTALDCSDVRVLVVVPHCPRGYGPPNGVGF
jgi:hypothetical protein